MSEEENTSSRRSFLTSVLGEKMAEKAVEAGKTAITVAKENPVATGATVGMVLSGPFAAVAAAVLANDKSRNKVVEAVKTTGQQGLFEVSRATTEMLRPK